MDEILNEIEITEEVKHHIINKLNNSFNQLESGEEIALWLNKLQMQIDAGKAGKDNI